MISRLLLAAAALGCAFPACAAPRSPLRLVDVTGAFDAFDPDRFGPERRDRQARHLAAARLGESRALRELEPLDPDKVRPLLETALDGLTHCPA